MADAAPGVERGDLANAVRIRVACEPCSVGHVRVGRGRSHHPSPWIAHALETVTGIGDVTLLIKHLAIVMAASFLLDYVHAIQERPHHKRASRLKLVFVIAAMTTLTALFVFWLPHDYTGADGLDAHYGHPGVQVYLAVIYTVYGVASAQAALLFWTNRRNVPPGPLRAGVTCLAAATANGLLYTVYRIYFVLREGDSTTLDADGKPVPLTDPVSELLPAVSVVLLVLGVSIPPTRTLLHYVRDQYALWRLHPLWADLVTAVPHVVLGTPTSRLRDLFTPGDRTIDVAHRAFAIRDAALALRDDTPTAVPASPAPDGGAEEDPAGDRSPLAPPRGTTAGQGPPGALSPRHARPFRRRPHPARGDRVAPQGRGRLPTRGKPRAARPRQPSVR